MQTFWSGGATTRVTEEGRSQGQGQFEQLSESLPQNKKSKKKWFRYIAFFN